jgi:hypothetical protein
MAIFHGKICPFGFQDPRCAMLAQHFEGVKVAAKQKAPNKQTAADQ